MEEAHTGPALSQDEAPDQLVASLWVFADAPSAASAERRVARVANDGDLVLSDALVLEWPAAGFSGRRLYGLPLTGPLADKQWEPVLSAIRAEFVGTDCRALVLFGADEVVGALASVMPGSAHHVVLSRPG